MRFLLILFLIIPLSCAEHHHFGKPVEDPSGILSSFQSFWKYQNTHIHLSDDFIGLDLSSDPMDKGEFLQELTTGKYLALRLQSDTVKYYQLFEVDHWKERAIRNTVMNLARTELGNFEREGVPFPTFKVEDLNGLSYSNESLKGKMVVLKLWFIGCKECVEEMPSLNKLLDSYKSQNDVVFLSMALDTDEALRKFLESTRFDYPVVGNQDGFIKKQLRAQIYPTHMVIDKAGKVVKVVNSFPELKRALERYI